MIFSKYQRWPGKSSGCSNTGQARRLSAFHVSSGAANASKISGPCAGIRELVRSKHTVNGGGVKRMP